jgi:PAS domain S-box-containing protein
MTTAKAVPACLFICDDRGDLVFSSIADTASLVDVMVVVRAVLAKETPAGQCAFPCAGGVVEVCRLASAGCSGYVFWFSPAEGSDAVYSRYDMVCRENRELKAAYDFSGEGIVLADETGVYISCNETYMRMTGLAWHDTVGKNAAEMIALGVKDYASAPAVLATKQTQCATQRFHSGLTTRLRGVPVFDDRGEVWRVVAYVRDISELERIRDELVSSREKLHSLSQETEWLQGRKYPLLFASKSMQAVREQAHKVAKVDSPVLILGETGVGKEVVTDLLHRVGPRCSAPLVKINCAAIPEPLLEAEFFGYEGGSFTDARKQGKPGLLETANKGTIFLDEVDSLPLGMQAKLLRFLQAQEFYRLGGNKLIRVDVRIIAASNQDLEALVNARQFRPDFFYRLNVLRIVVPPLRERVEDIIPLAHLSLDRFNAKYGLKKFLSPLIYKYILDYPWPGNIRELENAIERMVVEHNEDLLTVEALPRAIRQHSAPTERGYRRHGAREYRQERDAFEKAFWGEVFHRHRTTREAAQATGIAQSSVVKKYARYVEKQPFGAAPA